MKATIKVEKTVELVTLHVDAGVRYWEDAEVNGEDETDDGENIPCREGKRWKPVIDLETGKILNWEQGKTATIYYKVCDDGSYFLKDKNGETVLSIEKDYVPKIMCPAENGYGDYIYMEIDENGVIEDWKVDLSGFTDE